MRNHLDPHLTVDGPKVFFVSNRWHDAQRQPEPAGASRSQPAGRHSGATKHSASAEHGSPFLPWNIVQADNKAPYENSSLPL